MFDARADNFASVYSPTMQLLLARIFADIQAFPHDYPQYFTASQNEANRRNFVGTAVGVRAADSGWTLPFLDFAGLISHSFSSCKHARLLRIATEWLESTYTPELHAPARKTGGASQPGLVYATLYQYVRSGQLEQASRFLKDTNAYLTALVDGCVPSRVDTAHGLSIQGNVNIQPWIRLSASLSETLAGKGVPNALEQGILALLGGDEKPMQRCLEIVPTLAGRGRRAALPDAQLGLQYLRPGSPEDRLWLRARAAVQRFIAAIDASSRQTQGPSSGAGGAVPSPVLSPVLNPVEVAEATRVFRATVGQLEDRAVSAVVQADLHGFAALQLEAVQAIDRRADRLSNAQIKGVVEAFWVNVFALEQLLALENPSEHCEGVVADLRAVLRWTFEFLLERLAILAAGGQDSRRLKEFVRHFRFVHLLRPAACIEVLAGLCTVLVPGHPLGVQLMGVRGLRSPAEETICRFIRFGTKMVERSCRAAFDRDGRAAYQAAGVREDRFQAMLRMSVQKLRLRCINRYLLRGLPHVSLALRPGPGSSPSLGAPGPGPAHDDSASSAASDASSSTPAPASTRTAIEACANVAFLALAEAHPMPLFFSAYACVFVAKILHGTSAAHSLLVAETFLRAGGGAHAAGEGGQGELSEDGFVAQLRLDCKCLQQYLHAHLDEESLVRLATTLLGQLCAREAPDRQGVETLYAEYEAVYRHATLAASECLALLQRDALSPLEEAAPQTDHFKAAVVRAIAHRPDSELGEEYKDFRNILNVKQFRGLFRSLLQHVLGGTALLWTHTLYRHGQVQLALADRRLFFGSVQSSSWREPIGSVASVLQRVTSKKSNSVPLGTYLSTDQAAEIARVCIKAHQVMSD